MSHETHNNANSEIAKSKVAFVSSFWLIVILVGLFIAALNFIPAMAEKEGKGEKKEATEEVHGEKPAAEGEAKEAPKAEAAAPAPAAEAPKEAPIEAEHK